MTEDPRFLPVDGKRVTHHPGERCRACNCPVNISDLATPQAKGRDEAFYWCLWCTNVACVNNAGECWSNTAPVWTTFLPASALGN
jgi:hypothetical protein